MDNYVHSYWKNVREEIADYLMNRMDEGYLRYNPLRFNLGPDITGVSPLRRSRIRNILKKNDALGNFFRGFTESKIGQPVVDPVIGLGTPAIMGTSVDHFFYLSRITQELIPKFKSCVELGGGYGGLSRIIRIYQPKITYVLIDLPEALSLQLLYHKLNFPNFPAIPHYQEKIKIQSGALNLVPVWSFESLKVRPDIFISTYALTETTDQLREDVVKLNFFEAKTVYIVGGTDNKFKSHIQMQNLVKAKRKDVKIMPLRDNCYEILAGL